jgi:hypothetical protein
MFEGLSRWFVELGYIAVVVNAWLILVKCPCSNYRKLALWVTLILAGVWTFFYTSVNFHWFAPDVYAPLSRLFHSITIGGLLVQQFLIQRASAQPLVSLEELIQKAMKETPDESD